MAEKLVGNLRKGIVLVLSAPAGTGKTTLARMLIDEFPSVVESVSCTTRSKRGGEVEGKDYHFLDKELFQAKLEKGEFLEHATVFGNLYGTLRSHVEEEQEKGKHVILVIDTQGAINLMERGYPFVFVFVSPPSLAELRTRLFNRGTDAQHHIEERLSWAKEELEKATLYDYHFTNDNLHRAYDILRSILIAEEHKKERYHDRSIDK